MICKGCGADAPYLRITFEKGRKKEGCKYCNPSDRDILSFNFAVVGDGPQDFRMTAAHVKDVTHRRCDEDWSNPNEPRFSEPKQYYRPVHFDMGGKR